MKKKTHVIVRKYMILFRSEEDTSTSVLLLNAKTYEDAIKTARCVCGNKAHTCLVYKDVIVHVDE